MPEGDITDLRVTLARIEEKLDGALASGADHETRLRKLEKAAWMAVGLATAAGGATGAISAILTGGA
jgi:ABC-type uncharacterized transport system permease subunit